MFPDEYSKLLHFSERKNKDVSAKMFQTLLDRTHYLTGLYDDVNLKFLSVRRYYRYLSQSDFPKTLD